MLPTMARGLGSILFAINIDNEELNGTKVVSNSSFLCIYSYVQNVKHNILLPFGKVSLEIYIDLNP